MTYIIDTTFWLMIWLDCIHIVESPQLALLWSEEHELKNQLSSTPGFDIIHDIVIAFGNCHYHYDFRVQFGSTKNLSNSAKNNNNNAKHPKRWAETNREIHAYYRSADLVVYISRILGTVSITCMFTWLSESNSFLSILAPLRIALKCCILTL